MADLENKVPWSLTASRAGTYKFDTAGAYVDRDIQLIIPSASVSKGTTSVNASTKAVTRGTLDIGAGWISATGGDLAAATFANSATSGTTYVDISDTTAAPILVSDDYLYINQGYVDNLKISLKKLSPDGASGADAIKAGMLNSVSAYDNDGKLVTGNIATKSSADLSASGATVTVPAGYYATQATKSVATTSRSAGAGSAAATSTATSLLGTATTTKPGSGNYITVTGSGKVSTGAGYVTSGTTDSNTATVYYPVTGSTTTGSNNSATASASASITPTFAAGTTATTATTGYTKRVAASASSSVADVSASKTVSAGYTAGATVTATVTGASKTASSDLYILDGVITNPATAPSGVTPTQINAGNVIKIGKGYYTEDKYYKAQNAAATQAITNTLSSSIDTGYTAPTLVTSKTTGTPYITLSAQGSMTTGNAYNGTSTADTKYLKVYAGSYSIT